jgi:hypothetical protein
MSPKEAQAAYDAAEPIPMSEERIQEIVDYATGTDADRAAIRSRQLKAQEDSPAPNRGELP